MKALNSGIGTSNGNRDRSQIYYKGKIDID